MSYPFTALNESNQVRHVHTRFRAYQLGEEGSSFSLYAGGMFTLIEARVTSMSYPSLRAELAACGKQCVDHLHITSWDDDHCHHTELAWILKHLQPRKIEYPGYAPHTDCAHQSLKLILQYQAGRSARGIATSVQRVDPAYISSLARGAALGYRDMFYHPRSIFADSNDNSTVKLFRAGMFNVASLGDIDHANIGSLLRACKSIFCNEVDVLIVSHHGADNEVNTRRFFEAVRPSVAICSSNYDNQFDHPRPEVRERLSQVGARLFTTKTGDVLVESVASHSTRYQVTNLVADSERVATVVQFTSKKSRLLSFNADTIRNRYRPGFKGLR